MSPDTDTRSSPPAGWVWSDEDTLTHEATGSQLLREDPALGGWVLRAQVESDGYRAHVTQTTFIDAGADPLRDPEVVETLEAVEDGSERLEAISIGDPVNESFVDVICVRPDQLPDDVEPADIRQHADELVGVLYGEPVDQTAELLSEIAEPADRVPIEIFPTGVQYVTDLEVLDDDDGAE